MSTDTPMTTTDAPVPERNPHNFERMYSCATSAKGFLECAESHFEDGNLEDAKYNLMAAGDVAYTLLATIKRSVRILERRMERK